MLAVKRQRFLARAATAQWDCIIITHSAFKFIPAPAEFERQLIADQIQSYSDLLERVDGADRLSRKRIERMKEGLEEDLDALKSRKDIGHGAIDVRGIGGADHLERAGRTAAS
jgi:N12 class adenine-specific DNA methylase